MKKNPLYPQSNSLYPINPFAITKRNKNQEDLLRYADLVSHALYCCVNKTPDNFGITEPRYLKELSSRFGTDQSGEVIGRGIKPIHSLNHLKLDTEIEEALQSMRAKPPPKPVRKT